VEQPETPAPVETLLQGSQGTQGIQGIVCILGVPQRQGARPKRHRLQPTVATNKIANISSLFMAHISIKIQYSEKAANTIRQETLQHLK
jgi:hypothetical protein